MDVHKPRTTVTAAHGVSPGDAAAVLAYSGEGPGGGRDLAKLRELKRRSKALKRSKRAAKQLDTYIHK